MPTLFRVFPLAPSVHPGDPGGALYVPPQGGGRIDNPGVYSVLYLSDAAAGAIAEAFGRFPEWTPAILEGSPSLPGSVRAIARYHLPAGVRICDLNEPAQLMELNLKPSSVVSRDDSRTRGWARRIHDEGAWAGIRWWSYYDSRWASLGLWDVSELRLEEVTVLRLDDAFLLEAARTIARRVTSKAG